MTNDCDKIANTEKDCFRKDTIFSSYLMTFQSIFKNTQKMRLTVSLIFYLIILAKISLQGLSSQDIHRMCHGNLPHHLS